MTDGGEKVAAIGYGESDVTILKFPVISRIVISELRDITSAATLAVRQNDYLKAEALITQLEVLLAEYTRLDALVGDLLSGGVVK